MYSVQKDDKDAGFPPIMAARIKALLYNQFFYCPKKGSGLTYDSIARLDRLFFTRPIYPVFQPTASAIADDCLLVIASMLTLLLGLPMPGKERATYMALRDLAWETMPEDARPH